MQTVKRRYLPVFLGLTLALVVLTLLNICIGSVQVPLADIPRILLDPNLAESDTLGGIVWKIRLPRLLAAILLGGALALAGFLLQTFFNNPIAGPYVLGISSGAKLTVSIVLVCMLSAGRSMGSFGLIAAAFLGAMLAMGFVLLISQKIQRAAMLIVSGVMVGYICSAITDFIITFADDASIINLHNWSRGSFNGIGWPDLQVIALVVIPTVLLTFLLSKPIGAYQLGEGYAQNMGVNIRRFRVILVLLSSFLAACVTAFAGPVSFVGIAAPHLVRAMLKTAKPLVVIPACFLGGACFCLGCDLIARTIFAPVELAISSVTAIFGAPVVIAVMMNRRKED